MAFDKELYPDCTEGPLGITMKDAIAKQVEAVLKENPTHGDTILKLASAAEVTMDAEPRSEVSKITTDSIDHDHEIVVAKGIDLSVYQSNPVVLLNHNWMGLPLGKSLWVKNHGNGLTAKSQYASRPTDHQGEWLPSSIYDLIKQGMMPGKSLGFLPVESRQPTKAEIAARPTLKEVRRIWEKTMMVEYSVVAVPANKEALVETVSKSYPALAAVMGIKEPDQPDESMTLEKVIEELTTIKQAMITCDTAKFIVDRLGSLESDSEAFKIAIKSIRKDLLLKGGKPPEPESVPCLAGAVASELRKMFANG